MVEGIVAAADVRSGDSDYVSLLYSLHHVLLPLNMGHEIYTKQVKLWYWA